MPEWTVKLYAEDGKHLATQEVDSMSEAMIWLESIRVPNPRGAFTVRVEDGDHAGFWVHLGAVGVK